MRTGLPSPMGCLQLLPPFLLLNTGDPIEKGHKVSGVSCLGSSTQFPLRAGPEGPVEGQVITATAAEVLQRSLHLMSPPSTFLQSKLTELDPAPKTLIIGCTVWERDYEGPIPRRIRPKADPPPL